MPDHPGRSGDNPFYSRGDIAQRYERSRALPADVERQWAELLARHVPSLHAQSRPATCVDLGCGTGRFTRVLASAFGGRVVGVDPSRPMLRVAAGALRGTPGVALVHGRAEDVPLAAGCADVVLMSMSYHHVRDKPAALASVRRTLRPGGAFCVRTCTLDVLDSYLYQRFFPQARQFDLLRFPSRQALVEQVTAAGFALEASATVRDRVADGPRAYLENVSARAHSDLQAVTDEQFAAGMKQLDEWAAAHADEGPVFHEVDLFTFAAP